METMKRPGLHAGWLAGVVFTVALAVVAAITPGYEHAHQPVSFLGMHGAPFALSWNLFGFGLPGLLVACFALSLQAALAHRGVGAVARIGTWLLLISGVAFAGLRPQGVHTYPGSYPPGAIGFPPLIHQTGRVIPNELVDITPQSLIWERFSATLDRLQTGMGTCG